VGRFFARPGEKTTHNNVRLCHAARGARSVAQAPCLMLQYPVL